ncbi:MAG: phosphatidylserine decarboxylase [Elusimicrobia bacterium RIFOXYB2_FULL_49_7]|nr:MAG: phosphatidylserine decarboxylase [Elusimicrobia bacterium RIFOXYB2_FULL_49_7]
MAKEGLPIVLPLLVVVIAFGLLFARSGSNLLFALLCFFGVLTAFCAFFFRDPERTIPQAPGLLVSPADGKVCLITEIDDPYCGGRVRQVSIFLNVFNVHVNRIPAAGTVELVKYYPGKFLAAWNHKASLDNEQSHVGIRCGTYKILVKQIAGFIARRVICKAKEGITYQRGDRLGLIRFGSRTDLLMPLSADIKVKVGDKVQGGTSIIAQLL